MSDLSQTEILSLDYEGKIQMLQQIAQEMLNFRMEYAKMSGREAEIRANLTVLKEVKSAIQSALKAESV
jgi:hypothetical protein